MTLLHFLKALRTYWWVVVVAALLGGAVGAGMKVTSSPTYSAKSSVILTPRIQAGSDPGSLATFAEGLMSSYGELATAQPTLQPLAQQLGDGTAWSDLRGQVQAQVPVGSTLINITVKDADAQRAAQVANGIPGQLSKVIASLNAGPSGSPVTVTQLDQASAASAPDGSSLPAAAALGVFVGAVVGMILAAMMYVLRLRSREHAS